MSDRNDHGANNETGQGARDASPSDVSAVSPKGMKSARERYLAARKASAQSDKIKRDHKRAASMASKPVSVLSVKPHGAPKKDGTPRRDQLPGYGGPPPREEGERGRPTIFPPELRAQWIEALLKWLQTGKSLAGFVRMHPQGPGLSHWFLWRQQDRIFAEEYSRAREDGADVFADEIVTIADDVKDAGPQDSARVNAARLRVDARKWAASKLKPKTYADRIEQGLQVTLSGVIEHRITDDERARALASILARQAIAEASDMNQAVRMIEGTVHDVTPRQSADAKPDKPDAT